MKLSALIRKLQELQDMYVTGREGVSDRDVLIEGEGDQIRFLSIDLKELRAERRGKIPKGSTAVYIFTTTKD